MIEAMVVSDDANRRLSCACAERPNNAASAHVSPTAAATVLLRVILVLPMLTAAYLYCARMFFAMTMRWIWEVPS